MSSLGTRRKQIKKRNDAEKRFFLYVIFYHFFSGIAGLFKHD